MYTQCPYCQTLFRINAEQLRIASGKAHCCNCNQIFDALENLHEMEPGQTQEQKNPAQQQLDLTPPKATVTTYTADSDLVGLLRDIDNSTLAMEDAAVDMDSTLLDSQPIDPFEPEYDLTDLDQDSFTLDTELVDTPPDDAPPPPPFSTPEKHGAEENGIAVTEETDNTSDGNDDHHAEDATTGEIEEIEEIASLDSEEDHADDEETTTGPEADAPETLGAQIAQRDMADQPNSASTDTPIETLAEGTITDTADPALAPPEAHNAEAPAWLSSDPQPVDAPTTTPLAEPPFELPDDLPPIPPTEISALEGDINDAESRPSGVSSAIWSLGILLLVGFALAQGAWYQRDLLMQIPEGRQLLELACRPLPCQPPPRLAPEKIEVISRSINVHPDNPQALQVLLTVANRASFSQPPPRLQLSLYNTEEALVARRTFSPEEYQAMQPNSPLQPGRPHRIRFNLEDPGEQVTGFKFDFL